MKVKIFSRSECAATASEFREECFPVGELGGVSAETNGLTYRVGVHRCGNGYGLRDVVLEPGCSRRVKGFWVSAFVTVSGRAASRDG